jgi:hypothetical protein
MCITQRQKFNKRNHANHNAVSKFYTGLPRLIARRRYCVFYKLKFCGNPASNKSTGAIFPTCAHFVSLCHTLVIFAIFQTFHHCYTCYGGL